jgi:hypothetical protein|tara:strand:- start:199 stop:480 length:282 start_codon:yes stop_codon:yes gene_type:complete
MLQCRGKEELSFNLYYIRAAIEQRTGQRLKFDRIRQLLVEEGLVSQAELESNPLSKEFDGYGRYFVTEDCSVAVPHDPRRFIPALIDDEFDDE